MAAPLTLVLILAVTIRAVLFRSSLAALISERVEVVSPLNSWKRVVEGLALLDLGVSPYSGDVFHETPLIIYLFHFVVDYAEIVFMIADGITAVALYLSVKSYNKNVGVYLYSGMYWKYEREVYITPANHQKDFSSLWSLFGSNGQLG